MPNKYKQLMVKLGDIRSTTASNEQLNDIEQRLGHELPPDYREFLRDYSDCSFSGRLVVFPYIRGDYETQGSIAMFYGVSPVESDIAERYHLSLQYQEPEEASLYPGLNQIRNFEEDEEIGWPEELLPIGSDVGGNQICLALYGLNPGAVFYRMNSPTRNYLNLYLLASSFDGFMHLLRKGE